MVDIDDEVVIPPERKSKRKRATVKRFTYEDGEGSDADADVDGGADNDADVGAKMIAIDSSSCDSGDDEAYVD